MCRTVNNTCQNYYRCFSASLICNVMYRTVKGCLGVAYYSLSAWYCWACIYIYVYIYVYTYICIVLCSHITNIHNSIGILRWTNIFPAGISKAYFPALPFTGSHFHIALPLYIFAFKMFSYIENRACAA